MDHQGFDRKRHWRSRAPQIRIAGTPGTDSRRNIRNKPAPQTAAGTPGRLCSPTRATGCSGRWRRWDAEVGGRWVALLLLVGAGRSRARNGQESRAAGCWRLWRTAREVHTTGTDLRPARGLDWSGGRRSARDLRPAGTVAGAVADRCCLAVEDDDSRATTEFSNWG